jgi:ketosteroid isomerase-like protein
LSAAFAHVWTVRGDKLARFDMHTDTAKVLEAMQN